MAVARKKHAASRKGRVKAGTSRASSTPAEKSSRTTSAREPVARLAPGLSTEAAIVRSIPQGALVLTEEGDIVYASAAAGRLLHRQPEQIVGRNIVDLELIRALSGHPIHSFPKWLSRRRDGKGGLVTNLNRSRFTASLSAQVLPFRGAAPGKWVLSLWQARSFDLAAREIARFLDAVADPIIVLEDDGRILQFNRAASGLFGYTPEKIIGQSITRLFPRSHRPQLLELMFASIDARREDTQVTAMLPVIRSGREKLIVEASVSTTETVGRRSHTLILRDVTAREKTLKAERRESDLRRVILDNINEGIAVFDAKGRILAINDRHIDMLGLPRDVARVGGHWNDLVLALARKGVYGKGDKKQILDKRRRARSRHFEMDEMTFPDGQVFAIRRRRLPGGGFVSTFRDVSVRRRSAAKLREALENASRLSETQTAILDALPGHIALLDAKGKIQAVNRSWPRFCSLQRLPVKAGGVGGDYLAICTRAKRPFGASSAEIVKGIRSVLRGRSDEYGCEYRLKRKSGDLWYAVLVRPAGKKARSGVVVMHMDVTDRKRAEQQARVSGERLRAIVESSGDGILTLRRDGHIESANGAAVQIFARSSKRIAGTHISRLLPDFPFFRKGGATAGVPALYHAELMGEQARGRRFPTDVVMTLARQTDEPTYILNVRDITEQRTMHEELVQASKLANLGEMAAGMAHELNQPLNVIRMSADNAGMRLERGVAQSDYLMEVLSGVADQAAKMGEMILDLRIFSRREERGDLVPFSPCDSVSAACRLMRGQLFLDSIELTENCSPDCPQLFGNPTRLEQVLVNLIGNARDAIKHRPNGGARGRVGVTVARGDEGCIRIQVRDNGGGIPKKIIDKIFNPFFTSKPVGKGTGLGLSVSYGIVASMGGTIAARNVAHGALLEISLPIERGGMDMEEEHGRGIAVEERARRRAATQESARQGRRHG